MLVGKHGQFLRGLQTAFHRVAMERSYATVFLGGQRACWLAVHDPLKRPCERHRFFEAAHFIGRQSIRNCPTLRGLDPELLELAEWDARNGVPACVEHHRRFDNHADAGPGSAIAVPVEAIYPELAEFIAEWGLESEAERRFPAA
jgi:hypothetical protein